MTINVGITNYKGLALDSCTHFFGTPVVPKKLARFKFEKEEIFVGQINFADVAPFDTENILPKTGMLYIFFDVFAHTYSLYQFKEEGTIELENFNKKFETTGRFTSAMQLVFSIPRDEDEAISYGTKMLADIPQMVKDKYPKYANGYKALLIMCPPKLDYFEKQYLLNIEKYSVIAISEKDLKKGKLTNVVTLNV